MTVKLNIIMVIMVVIIVIIMTVIIITSIRRIIIIIVSVIVVDVVVVKIMSFVGPILSKCTRKISIQYILRHPLLLFHSNFIHVCGAMLPHRCMRTTPLFDLVHE